MASDLFKGRVWGRDLISQKEHQPGKGSPRHPLRLSELVHMDSNQLGPWSAPDMWHSLPVHTQGTDGTGMRKKVVGRFWLFLLKGKHSWE